MAHTALEISQSPPLQGTAELVGAKNAVLVSMAALLLAKGTSTLRNVPDSEDVRAMIALLTSLGAQVTHQIEERTLVVDTSACQAAQIPKEIMRKMRASILVMGPLLARFGVADMTVPGGCVLGARPIDYHVAAFERMGAHCTFEGETLHAQAESLQARDHVLMYPSVGATENILMAATLTAGTTRIINAALEPEVLDLIALLRAMGAQIELEPPATICIQGVSTLQPVNYMVMHDRLEAGTLLAAASITGGTVSLPEAPARDMKIFLAVLEQMGHEITVGKNGIGVTLRAAERPRAVSFKTMPYPGFPTDLQAPLMAALCVASGTSVVHETVFENRLVHVRELQKMGAQISVHGQTATIVGVDELYGAPVIASDIRAGAALVIAGLAAQCTTTVTGVHHLQRGYDNLVGKLASLGGSVCYVSQGS